MGRGAYTLTWLRAVVGHPDLKTRARMVAAVLAIHLNADGEAWPSLQTLAREAGYKSLKPVRQAIEELVTAKLLVVRPGGGRHNTHHYKALLPSTETVPAEHQTGDTGSAGRGHGSAETVDSDAESGDSGDPNSSELNKNSYSPSELDEAKELLGVPEGQTIGSFIIDETRRGNTKVAESSGQLALPL